MPVLPVQDAPPVFQGTAHRLRESDYLLRAEDLIPAFAERAAEYDRERAFPFRNFMDLQEAGLLSLTVPRRYEGSQVSLSTAAGVIQRVAQGDASTALVLTMHYIMHATIELTGRWPQAIHQRICQESVTGIALLNAARVEPELGTPARGGLPATTAQRTESGWEITGHKLYTTGSPMLRYFLVWAKTDEPEPRVGTFLVPRTAPGIHIEDTWDHLGMRATGSHDLILEQTPIPLDHAVDVRTLKDWGDRPPGLLIWGSVLLSALYQGVATAARDWLSDYLHERIPSNLGSPLASLPRFQSVFGEIEALLYANRQLIAGIAQAYDSGQDPKGLAQEAGFVKYLTTNQSVKAVEIGLNLIGNPGLTQRNPIQRHYRDVLCSRIHTPQDDVILLGAGKRGLGLS